MLLPVLGVKRVVALVCCNTYNAEEGERRGSCPVQEHLVAMSARAYMVVFESMRMYRLLMRYRYGYHQHAASCESISCRVPARFGAPARRTGTPIDGLTPRNSNHRYIIRSIGSDPSQTHLDGYLSMFIISSKALTARDQVSPSTQGHLFNLRGVG